MAFQKQFSIEKLSRKVFYVKIVIFPGKFLIDLSLLFMFFSFRNQNKKYFVFCFDFFLGILRNSFCYQVCVYSLKNRLGFLNCFLCGFVAKMAQYSARFRRDLVSHTRRVQDLFKRCVRNETSYFRDKYVPETFNFVYFLYLIHIRMIFYYI